MNSSVDTSPARFFPTALDLTEEDLKAIAAEASRAFAFDQVVRKYNDKLTSHALYIMRDREEAHDVVQEVFIKAMREPRFFETEFKIQAWLYRVTRNLCFNLVRDRRRREVILYGQRRSEVAANDPLQSLFLGERQREMLAAMELLSEDHGEILLLRYYEDLSYAEISDRLSIRLGTVMSRLSRARERLLAVMGRDAAMLEAS